MPIAVTRRDFYKRSAHKGSVMLPPWALSAEVFYDLCDGCADCVAACPEQILSVNGDSIATVNFEDGACDFCGKCEVACKANALMNHGQPAWSHKAEITAECLSSQGIVCRLCGDACESQAINFKLYLAGRSIPFISSDLCNGCGGCQMVCPVDAVRFNKVEDKELRS